MKDFSFTIEIHLPFCCFCFPLYTDCFPFVEFFFSILKLAQEDMVLKNLLIFSNIEMFLLETLML